MQDGAVLPDIIRQKGGLQIKNVVISEKPQNGNVATGPTDNPTSGEVTPENVDGLDKDLKGSDKANIENDRTMVRLENELGEDVGPLSVELFFATRESLAVIEAGGDRFKAYETRGEQIVADANNLETKLTDKQRQERTALGLDMQIDGLNMQYQELAAKSQKLSGKKKEEINQRLNELKDKINKVADEREKIKLPNQLSEFAQLFGISAENASKFPLAQVEAYINEAINNGKFRQELVENLKSNPDLQTEEAKSTIAAFENYLNAQGRRKTIEKGAKTVGKIGLGALLMSLIMMWMSSKEKKQQ